MLWTNSVDFGIWSCMFPLAPSLTLPEAGFSPPALSPPKRQRTGFPAHQRNTTRQNKNGQDHRGIRVSSLWPDDVHLRGQSDAPAFHLQPSTFNLQPPTSSLQLPNHPPPPPVSSSQPRPH